MLDDVILEITRSCLVFLPVITDRICPDVIPGNLTKYKLTGAAD
jgi:hypothetical protein